MMATGLRLEWQWSDWSCWSGHRCSDGVLHWFSMVGVTLWWWSRCWVTTETLPAGTGDWRPEQCQAAHTDSRIHMILVTRVQWAPVWCQLSRVVSLHSSRPLSIQPSTITLSHTSSPSPSSSPSSSPSCLLTTRAKYQLRHMFEGMTPATLTLHHIDTILLTYFRGTLPVNYYQTNIRLIFFYNASRFIIKDFDHCFTLSKHSDQDKCVDISAKYFVAFSWTIVLMMIFQMIPARLISDENYCNKTSL